jgi:hypothetical protein
MYNEFSPLNLLKLGGSVNLLSRNSVALKKHVSTVVYTVRRLTSFPGVSFAAPSNPPLKVYRKKSSIIITSKANLKR